MRLLLLVLVLFVFAPGAAAHITHPNPSQVLDLAGFKIAVTPIPSPVTVATPTRFVLVDIEQHETRPLPPARFILPTGEEKEFHKNGTIWDTEPFTFAQNGDVAARIMLDGENPSEASVPFTVYRLFPFEFAPIDATSDPTEREPYTLTFRTLNRTTSEPEDALDDLRGGLSPVGRSGAEPFVFQKIGPADWSASVTFVSSGTWHIRLESDSGGFHGTEAAPWQVDVLPGSVAPGTSGLDGISTILLASVVAVGLLLSRSRA